MRKTPLAFLSATAIAAAAALLPISVQAHGGVSVAISTPEFGIRIGAPVFGPRVIAAPVMVPAPVYMPPAVFVPPPRVVHVPVVVAPSVPHHRWHRPVVVAPRIVYRPIVVHPRHGWTPPPRHHGHGHDGGRVDRHSPPQQVAWRR